MERDDIFKSLFGTFLIIIAILVIVMIFGWIGSGTNVVQKEFSPEAMLQKYEWFKNQSASIDKMDQDIKLFKTRISDLDTQYKEYGDSSSKWPPHIQVQYNNEKQQAREDLIAVVSQRNNIVREYNAQSSKFNWKYFDKTKTDIPKKAYNESPIN